jgi:hypothetical protein
VHAGSSSVSSIRQKPTRLPYSRHTQFGISGIRADPGAVNTVRMIGCCGSHSSTLTIIRTATPALLGNASSRHPAIGD